MQVSQFVMQHLNLKQLKPIRRLSKHKIMLAHLRSLGSLGRLLSDTVTTWRGKIGIWIAYAQYFVNDNLVVSFEVNFKVNLVVSRSNSRPILRGILGINLGKFPGTIWWSMKKRILVTTWWTISWQIRKKCRRHFGNNQFVFIGDYFVLIFRFNFGDTLRENVGENFWDNSLFNFVVRSSDFCQEMFSSMIFIFLLSKQCFNKSVVKWKLDNFVTVTNC